MKFMVTFALFLFSLILVSCEKKAEVEDADTELADVIEMDEEVVEASVKDAEEEVIIVDSDTVPDSN